MVYMRVYGAYWRCKWWKILPITMTITVLVGFNHYAMHGDKTFLSIYSDFFAPNSFFELGHRIDLDPTDRMKYMIELIAFNKKQADIAHKAFLADQLASLIAHNVSFSRIPEPRVDFIQCLVAPNGIRYFGDPFIWKETPEPKIDINNLLN